MDLSQLKPKIKRMTKKRIGRGGDRGKTSGRGHKGQGQHGSHGIRPHIRDIIKKLPKLRGYKFNSLQEKPLAVNLDDIAKHYSKGETVNPSTLAEKGIISKNEAVVKTIKVLGNGDISLALTFEGVKASSSAIEKITKAGGTISESE